MLLGDGDPGLAARARKPARPSAVRRGRCGQGRCPQQTPGVPHPGGALRHKEDAQGAWDTRFVFTLLFPKET